jgi:hypothetical protein
MSSLTFSVEADKIGTNVLDSIKAFFGKPKLLFLSNRTIANYLKLLNE